MRIRSLEDLKAVKEIGLAKLYPPERPKILVGMATCGLAAGAQKIFNFFRDRVRSSGWNGVVEKTACIGLCYEEPLVDLVFPGKPRLTYNRVDIKAAEAIWNELTAGKMPETNLLARLDTDEMLLDGGPRKFCEGDLDECLKNVPSYAELDFFKYQQHIAMRNCGFLDPDNMEHHIARGGYFAFHKALTTMKP
jgi:(2Fe-2S) ferredoxin